MGQGKGTRSGVGGLGPLSLGQELVQGLGE